MTASERTAERIASIGLVGASSDLIDVDDAGESGGAILAALSAERILGVAARGIDEGAIVGDEGGLAPIITAHDDVMAQTMRIEIKAVEASRQLDDAGIDHRILKGTALAHTVAERPADRSFRDVDLLVGGDDIDATVKLLLANGATRLQPELRPGYDARFGKSVTLRHDGIELDIHRLLSPGPFGVWMKPKELFLLKRHIEVGGGILPTLDPTDHLVHACYHVALGQVRPVLANLRDVALLSTAVTDPVDFDRFNETVTRWRGRAVIKRAVRLVQSRLDTELPDQLAGYGHSAVPADELEHIASYLDDDPRGRFAALAPATLRALPLSERPAYAMAVGLPEGSAPVDRVREILRRRQL